MIQLESLVDAIVRGTTLAAEVTRRVQAEDAGAHGALAKAGNEPVTVADYASQALILREIAIRFPTVSIISEEASAPLRKKQSESTLERVRQLVSDSLSQQVTREQLYAWIDHCGDKESQIAITVDPIDGTKGFLRGDHYAIAVGVLDVGTPVAGVLVCPNLETFDSADRKGVVVTAVRGGGAYEHPLDPEGASSRRIRVSARSHAGSLRMLASVESSHGDPKLVDDLIAAMDLRGGKVKIDSQVKYAVLARGDAEIYLRPRSTREWRDQVWDHVPGVAIALAASARVTDQDGKNLDFRTGRRLENNRGVLVTNGPQHDDIVRAIARLDGNHA